MAADFCLLNRLFAGLGKSQAWHTSIDFGTAIDKYGPFLHGHPRRVRRIVCETKDQLYSLRLVQQEDLKTIFLQYLADICGQAGPEDHVLILLFGHGGPEMSSYPFWVADEKTISTRDMGRNCGRVHR